MSVKYPECPLYNPINCKEYYNPKLCAFVKKDKICLKKNKTKNTAKQKYDGSKLVLQVLGENNKEDDSSRQYIRKA